MMLSIVESKRNKPILLLDTFRCTQDKVLSTTIYLKCETRSCPGRAIQHDQGWPESVNIGGLLLIL